jgi:cytochrome P450
VLYYLCRYPTVLKKLKSQVDAAIPRPEDWTYEKAKSITYIDDIINESLRLKPSLLHGGYRVTPPAGITVDGVFVPGDTNVFVPCQGLQTDPRYWTRAADFVPERFGELREEMGTDKSPFFPFGLGAYNCVGKNLAFLTLRTSISRLVQRFDIAFGPGETGDEFDSGTLETLTTTLPPVMVQFTPREK